MADDFVQVPPNSTGAKVDCTSLVVAGSTVERQRIVIASPSTAANIAEVTVGGALKIDATATTQPVSGSVSIATATSGGLLFYTGSIGSAVTSVKASAGQIYGYDLYNSNSSAVYIQVFNKLTGSVTLGTTVPDLVIVLPAIGGRNVSYAQGVAFSIGICFAVTTTRTGLTAPASNVDINFFYA